jgi:hypothetical protein
MQFDEQPDAAFAATPFRFPERSSSVSSSNDVMLRGGATWRMWNDANGVV